MEPLPTSTKLVEQSGLITRAWNQFLYTIFGRHEKRLDELEARVTALEEA